MTYRDSLSIDDWKLQDKFKPYEAACIIHNFDPRIGDLNFLRIKGYPSCNKIENTMKSLARYAKDKEDVETLIGRHQIKEWCDINNIICPKILYPKTLDLNHPKIKKYHEICKAVQKVFNDKGFNYKTEEDCFNEAHSRESLDASPSTIKSVWNGTNKSSLDKGFSKNYIRENYPTTKLS